MSRSRLLAAGAGAATLAAGLGVAALTAGPGAVAATVTTGTAPTVIINEVSTTNLSGATDEQSKRGDWVELYNTTSASIDLTGWGLSNTVKSPFRWVFPSGTTIAAKGYLRVWADKADRTTSTSNLHTSFNIDNGADAVALSAPNQTVLGQLVDSVTPPFTKPDVSYCRATNGDPRSAWTTCLAPTPGAANSGATANGLLSKPTLSVASGVYGAPQTVTATAGTAAVDAGSELRYTTDGTVPTATSPLVTGPITVSASGTLRVGAFKAGVLPSYVTTATYVIDASGRWAGQRAILISMAPSDRSSWWAGGSAPSSGWKAAVQMLAPDGTVAWSGDAATEQAGQIGSRNGQQTLPFEINFKDATGTKDVSYPIFSDKPTQTKYKKLRLRNAGDDYQEAHLRDQYWQILGAEAKLAPAASEPAQVFVNGTYYGMMDLREKEDETLVESSFGVDKDNVQFLSDTRVVSGEGTTAAFNAVSSYVTGNNMAVQANFDKAASMVDVENLAQDFALHLFAADDDWQWRNVHVFSTPGYDNKWRWRGHDYDISSDGTNAFGFNTTPSRDMSNRYCCYTQGNMLRALLANPQYKAFYANVVADQLNTVVSPAEAQAKLDAMAAAMSPYIDNQIAKNGQPTTRAKWETEVARLRSFITTRTPFYVQHTRTYLGLGAQAPVTVGVDDSARGTVKVNTVDLTTRMTGAGATWTGRYWTGTPVTITAKPKPGFAFTGWSDGVSTASRSVDPGSGVTYSATFAPLATVPAPVVTALPAQSATTATVVSVPVVASDPNGYALTYSAKTLPNGLDIHPQTGLVYGKPTRAGTFASVVTVSNGRTKTSVNVTWTVANKLDRLVTLPTTITGNGLGLTAAWSNDVSMAGTAAVTQVQSPAIALGTGSGPFPNYGTSSWSVRFAGYVTAPTTGSYSLRGTINADDGARIKVAGVTIADAWTTGVTTPTGTVDLVAGVPTPITIEFWDKSGAANLAMSWQLPGTTAFIPLDSGVLDPLAPGDTPPPDRTPGLKAAWSNDATLSGTAAVTQVQSPAIALGTGSGPFPGYGTSNWSVRFTGTITAPTTGSYSLRGTINADDGARIKVAGVTIADAWTTGVTTPTGTVDLVAGVPTPITIEFWDKSGAANLAMSWQLPGTTTFVPLDSGVLAPA